MRVAHAPMSFTGQVRQKRGRGKDVFYGNGRELPGGYALRSC
jgi:hypothetical protein